MSLPISGKLPITKYLIQNDFDYEGHLTIENWLKVKKIILFLKQAQLFPQERRFRYAFFYCT